MKRKLSVILLALLCALSICSCQNTGSASVSVTPEEGPPTVLKRSEDMGKDYIDSFVFFGESTTYHLKSRGVLSGGMNTTQVLADRSGTAILDGNTADMTVVYPESGELLSFREAIRRKKPKYLLLTFGLNGATAKVKRGEGYFKGCYLKLINAVRSASPDTKIILGSCFYVAENMDMSRYSVSLDELNGCISTMNGWALELCRDEGLRYLDMNEVLTDENDRLRLEYQVGDGHHLTKEAYVKIIEYIRTHGYR